MFFWRFWTTVEGLDDLRWVIPCNISYFQYIFKASETIPFDRIRSKYEPSKPPNQSGSVDNSYRDLFEQYPSELKSCDHNTRKDFLMEIGKSDVQGWLDNFFSEGLENTQQIAKVEE